MRVAIDVDDVFHRQEKRIRGRPELHDEVADPASRRVDQHAIYRTDRLVVAIAQVEIRQSPARALDVARGEIAKVCR